jgi:hypothetical protein
MVEYIMADLVQKARERFAELTKIIEAAQAVGQEWSELNSFLNQVETVRKRLEPQTGKDSEPERLPEPRVARPARPPLQKDGVNMTADLAEFVLAVHGPKMHLEDVLKHMLEEGWVGTGDHARDLKNLYNNLWAKKERFRNVGKNIWERVEAGDLTKQ